jgi:hypothetical protein
MALPPVVPVPNPHPYPRHPNPASMRRHDPMSPRPNPGIPSPGPIAPDPYITGSWRDGHSLDLDGRRRLLDHDLRWRLRGRLWLRLGLGRRLRDDRGRIHRLAWRRRVDLLRRRRRAGRWRAHHDRRRLAIDHHGFATRHTSHQQERAKGTDHWCPQIASMLHIHCPRRVRVHRSYIATTGVRAPPASTAVAGAPDK